MGAYASQMVLGDGDGNLLKSAYKQYTMLIPFQDAMDRYTQTL
jgi:hypothetical protein